MSRELLVAIVGGIIGSVLFVVARVALPHVVTAALTRWRLRGGFVSVRDGAWEDPTTWSRQQVPGNGARVVVRHRVKAPRTGAVTHGLRVFATGNGGLD